MGTKEITIILPTKNRAECLLRLLQYYSEVGFQGVFSIGDSSDGEHLKLNRKNVKLFGSKLKIVYQEYPELDEPQCSQQLVNMVNTRYVAWVADDDFLVPSSLEKCMQFLESNPGYSAAHGLDIKIETKDNMPYGEIIKCKFIYNQAVEEAESASERFLNYAKHPSSVQYSVFRTQTLQLIWKNNHIIHDRVSAGKFPEYLAVIKGKIKELDCLSLIRGRLSYKYSSSEQDNIYYWLTNEKWLSYFNIFQDAYIKELMQQDKIGLDKAQEVVRQFLLIFIFNRLIKSYKGCYPNDFNSLFAYRFPGFEPDLFLHKGRRNNKSLLKDFKQRVPGLARLKKKLIDLGFVSSASGNRYLSPLDPLSPYHKDFMPIYRVVTTLPEKYK